MSARSARLRRSGWVLAAAVIVGMGGYVLYGRLVDDVANETDDGGGQVIGTGPDDGYDETLDHRTTTDTTSREDTLGDESSDGGVDPVEHQSSGPGADRPETSNVLLLVSESDGYLYVGEAGREVSRDDRVVQDMRRIGWISVTRDDGWGLLRVAEVGDEHVVVAEAADGYGAWVIDGLESEKIASQSETVTAVVVGEMLYLVEVRDRVHRCYRVSTGELDDLERVFRGDYCSVSRSGYIMGVDASDDTFRVSVWAPQGKEEMSREEFTTRPTISENGLFLLGTDDQGVVVTSVESGNPVWEIDGAVNFHMASHPGGHVAVAAQAEAGEVVLVLVERDGTPNQLAYIPFGTLTAQFAESGDLFWIEGTLEGAGVLRTWSIDRGDVVELADERGLQLLGIFKTSAVTITQDDSSTSFLQYSLDDSRTRELYEFGDDHLEFVRIDGDYIYIAGRGKATVVPLDGGEPIESELWDGVTVLDYSNGALVAAGIDGSYEVLFSITAGYAAQVEYGRFDQVMSAQLYGNILYASVEGRSRRSIVVFDKFSGHRRDFGIDYEGYLLINNRERRISDVLQVKASQAARPLNGETTVEVDPDSVTHRSGEVKVAVVNGKGTPGLAGSAAGQLNALGYVTAVKNAVNFAMKTSVIYYKPGYYDDARAIAGALNAPAVTINPTPEMILSSIRDSETLGDFNIFIFYAADEVIPIAGLGD